MKYVIGIIVGLILGCVLAVFLSEAHPTIGFVAGAVLGLVGLYFLFFNQAIEVGSGLAVTGVVLFISGYINLQSYASEHKINLLGYILKPFYSLFYWLT